MSDIRSLRTPAGITRASRRIIDEQETWQLEGRVHKVPFRTQIMSADVVMPIEVMQIRVWGARGWTQLMLDERHALLAFSTAGTEKASFAAAKAQLAARGVIL